MAVWRRLRATYVKVLLVRRELVNALEIVVAAHDLVRHTERAQVLSGGLVAAGGASEELRGVGLDRLGLAEVAERAESDRDLRGSGGARVLCVWWRWWWGGWGDSNVE